MTDTLLVSHPACAGHRMQPRHPEAPERLAAVLEYLGASGAASAMQPMQALPATAEDLALVHPQAYLQTIAAAEPAEGLTRVDPDTALGPGSHAAALHATGGCVAATRAVLAGTARRAFCVVRPPGHHAETAAAMGFCFFNSIAVAARVALANGLQRVAVLDFDVHHGNGTVEVFRDDPRVLVCSSFQHPWYPGRMHDVERAHIVNTPLPAGTGSTAFRAAIEAAWLPALETHRPQLVLVSAGFDAHRDDPLAGLELIEDDYHWVTRLITDAARRFADGRVVSTLEGGYHLDALARSAGAHVEALLEA